MEHNEIVYKMIQEGLPLRGDPLSFTTKLSRPSTIRMWQNMEDNKESAKR